MVILQGREGWVRGGDIAGQGGMVILQGREGWVRGGIKVSLTAMYAAHPALLVLALESTSRPLMPKSQSLICPRSSNRIFEGFTSEKNTTL